MYRKVLSLENERIYSSASAEVPGAKRANFQQKVALAVHLKELAELTERINQPIAV